MKTETETITPLRDADWAATVLGLKKPRVYELARRGILPCVRLGRQMRFSEQAILEFIESGGRALGDHEDNGGVVPLRRSVSEKI